MRHKFILVYAWLVRTMLYFYPDMPAVMRFRGWLYGKAMAECGRNFQVTHSAIINGLDLCKVGRDVYIANGCHLICNGTLTIGDAVIFGPGVVVSTGNHQTNGSDYRYSPSTKEDVTIGSGCWIGGNVSIVGGAKVPDKSVVAAGATITRKSCNGITGVYAGVPAKLVKSL